MKAANSKRRGIVYVKQLAELPRKHAEFVTEVDIVHRRLYKGATAEKMYRLVLCSEQEGARIRELRLRLRDSRFGPSAYLNRET